jgi:hypothetical protein
VLVTDVDYPLESIGQLYRDRADAENAFDELKNQWGLSGFTTQDLNRCQTVARACALVYNWWSWYCRAAHPGGRLEAITSRPLLLAAVGKAASHANQTTLYRLVQQHAATFFAQAEDAAGADLPQFIKDEFDAFLECGILAHGFLRLRCGDCGHDKLVAFSCKRRGSCPSCGARRMAQTAAHLVDHVIPHVPVRQWVLSLPITPRCACCWPHSPSW